MSPTRDDRVRSFFLEQVGAPLHDAGIPPEDVTDDFDLLSEGVLDSLGLVELITAFEERFRVVVDLEEMAIDEITVVGPFCRYIERQLLEQQD